MLRTLVVRIVLAVCIAAAVCGLNAADSQAATITVTATYDGVTPGGCTPAECTLRDAIILANSTPEPDVINLPAGVFNVLTGGASGREEDLSLTGDLDITGPVTIIGQGATSTKLYGPYDRVLDIHPPAGTVILQDIGYVNTEGIWAVINGGAIRCTGPGPNLTVVNSKFTQNSAGASGGNGGAMYLDNCVTTIQNTTFERNYTIAAGSSGGAVYARLGTLAINYVRITGNNSQGSGGGVYLDSCTTTIEMSTIHANNAGGMGGGVHIESESAKIESSLIVGNFALVAGGGVFNAGNDTIITNSTIGENTTSGSGGGVSNAGMMTIRHSTITRNLANRDNGTGNGGGVATVRAGVQLNVASTIIAGNMRNPDGQNDCSQAAGSVVSQGHNLVKAPGGCSSFSTINDDILGVDPLLGNLVNNGGYTLTYALLRGSPAVNHGEVVSGETPLYDQRGEGYPRVLIGRVDIGAFEAEGLETYLPLVLRLP